jgi:hypothetical protein
VNRRVIVFGAVLLSLSTSCGLTQESPAAFVQRFYDSYLKEAPHWAKTIRTRRALFDPALADALQEDAAAQAKVAGDIVGLDFDPFLGSQDPGTHFAARRVIPMPGGYRVDVYDSSSPSKPMVLIDVASRDGYWIITDFRYPNTSSELRSILKTLRQERQRQ